MYNLKNSVQIVGDIDQISQAVERECWIGSSERDDNGNLAHFSGANIKKWKIIQVENKAIACVGKDYKLVQHKEAFAPIMKGLEATNIKDYNFSLFCNHRRAWLNIFVGDGFDTVKFGFRVMNGIDGKTGIRYGLSAVTQTRVLELVGYRQICSNGLVVRVNLDDSEFVKEEERIKIDSILSEKLSFTHTGDVQERIKEVQYVVEAFTLLKTPLARIIKKAKKIELTKKQAKQFVEKYVGVRKRDKVMYQYASEEQNLWGLYNSITYLSSRISETKATKMDTMMGKATDMLEEEIKVEVS